MHLDEERIQRLLHGELARADETEARAHVAQCDGCRGRLVEAEREEREVLGLLRSLDGPAPVVGVESVLARAGAPDSARHARARTRGLPRPGRWLHARPLQWAAGFVIAAIVAGAAYAVPGSPVRTWVDAVVQRVGGGRGDGSGGTPEPSESQWSGIAVRAGSGLVIRFAAAGAGARALVTLTDDAEVTVRSPVGAATFTTTEGGLEIDRVAPSAEFRIAIPRAAARVEIQVSGRRVFLKEGARIEAPGPAGADGVHTLTLAPPAP